MGLPINNFTFFAYLESDRETHFPEEGKFREIKNKFSLFGYIIHDPQSKDGFGELLTRRFRHLSDLTGFNFLFTAFISVPSENDRDRFRTDPDHLRSGLDESLASDLPYFYAEFISERLNINSSSLPYIIVTDDPKQSRYYVIELNSDNLLKVMWDLTGVADNLKRLRKFSRNLGVSDPKDEFLKEVSFGNLMEKLGTAVFKIEAEKSLSKQLLECALILQNYSRDKYKYLGIEDFVSNEWQENFRKKLGSAEQEELKTAELLRKVTGQGEFLGPKKEHFLMELMEIQMEADFQNFKSFLENDSYANLLDGALLMRYYDESLFTDASPFILPFLKAFEKEMNYSLVHWIRENLQIDLPEYFFRYQPDKLAVLNKGESRLDYNRLKTNSTFWQPPMIGGQVYGLEILFQEQSVSPFKTPDATQSFLEIGEKIMGIRNQATHTGKHGAKSLRLMIHKWRELWKDGYLWELSQLKFRYKK